jgi:hypothetical protein
VAVPVRVEEGEGVGGDPDFAESRWDLRILSLDLPFPFSCHGFDLDLSMLCWPPRSSVSTSWLVKNARWRQSGGALDPGSMEGYGLVRSCGIFSLTGARRIFFYCNFF